MEVNEEVFTELDSQLENDISDNDISDSDIVDSIYNKFKKLPDADNLIIFENFVSNNHNVCYANSALQALISCGVHFFQTVIICFINLEEISIFKNEFK